MLINRHYHDWTNLMLIIDVEIASFMDIIISSSLFSFTSDMNIIRSVIRDSALSHFID